MFRSTTILFAFIGFLVSACGDTIVVKSGADVPPTNPGDVVITSPMADALVRGQSQAAAFTSYIACGRNISVEDGFAGRAFDALRPAVARLSQDQLADAETTIRFAGLPGSCYTAIVPGNSRPEDIITQERTRDKNGLPVLMVLRRIDNSAVLVAYAIPLTRPSIVVVPKAPSESIGIWGMAGNGTPRLFCSNPAARNVVIGSTKRSAINGASMAGCVIKSIVIGAKWINRSQALQQSADGLWVLPQTFVFPDGSTWYAVDPLQVTYAGSQPPTNYHLAIWWKS